MDERSLLRRLVALARFGNQYAHAKVAWKWNPCESTRERLDEMIRRDRETWPRPVSERDPIGPR